MKEPNDILIDRAGDPQETYTIKSQIMLDKKTEILAKLGHAVTHIREAEAEIYRILDNEDIKFSQIEEEKIDQAFTDILEVKEKVYTKLFN